ncbi:MAG: hypothetical protein ACUVS7_15940 [Bryobacteraceae bacterium]
MVMPARAGAAEGERRIACRLEAREWVWLKIARRGLVWQPDLGHETAGLRPLVLSSAREWTVEHWKDAALHVLKLEAGLREAGWTLSSVALRWVQFAGCRPVWISQTVLRPRRTDRWEAQTE